MNRMLRVNELIRREIGTYLERGICTDFECLVTVTDVKTSRDLRQSIVYFSVYGGSDLSDKVLRRLQAHRPDIQNIIAKNIKLKYTPKLRFEIDDTQIKSDRINRILENLESKTPDE